MKFYHKYYDSCYEELISYYPTFYRNIYEMTELLKAQGTIADELEHNIEQTYLNCFIDYADEQTIQKLELFLKIGKSKNCSLEERRRLVKSYFVGFGKISATIIGRMINTYTDSEVNCRFESYDRAGNQALFLRFEQELKHPLNASVLVQMLSRKLPAHIKYIAEFEHEITHRNLEKLFFRNLKLHTNIRFWDCYLFDGSFLMDGTILFEQKRRYFLLPKIRCGADICQKENFSLPFIIVKRNPHFWDGSVTFDGSVIANAVYRKEEME